jgi:hypothetical protein
MIKMSLGKAPSFPGPRPWYDSKKQVEESIKNLAGLLSLVRRRHLAGYGDGERLNEFYLFGRYCLDSCGNCCKESGKSLKDLFPNIPDVLTDEELKSFLTSQSGEKDIQLSFSYNGGQLPLLILRCAYCKKTWDVANCHDTHVVQTSETLPLTDFIGKTLGEVRGAYATKDDAIYRMQSDILIRNDRFIDLSPKYPNPEHNWEKSIINNERGWVSEKDGITDDYIIQNGDEGYFNVWTYYHKRCHIQSVVDDPMFLCKDGHFKNLAGAAYADVIIEKELKEAGIEIVNEDRIQSEVPFTLTGKLGTFLFGRAWTYWVVSCMMPLDAANEMYENEVGKKFVRVAGHCGCPPPNEWALPCEKDLKKAMKELGLESATYGELAELQNNGKINAPRYVQTYHIDTMPGLKFFVETTRKYGLA